VPIEQYESKLLVSTFPRANRYDLRYRKFVCAKSDVEESWEIERES
jgi:hypothetical protein